MRRERYQDSNEREGQGRKDGPRIRVFRNPKGEGEPVVHEGMGRLPETRTHPRRNTRTPHIVYLPTG